MTKIYSKCLDELNITYSILISEYIKGELGKSGKNKKDTKDTNGKGVVIDVTEE